MNLLTLFQCKRVVIKSQPSVKSSLVAERERDSKGEPQARAREDTLFAQAKSRAIKLYILATSLK